MYSTSRSFTKGLIVTIAVLVFALALWLVLRSYESSLRGGSRYWQLSLLVAIIWGVITAFVAGRRAEQTNELVVAIDRLASNPRMPLVLSPTQIAQQLPVVHHLAWASENISQTIGQLQLQGKQNARVLENMVDGVLVIDDRSRLIGLNPSARRLLQINADDVLNRPLLDVVRMPEIVQAVRMVLQEKKVHEQVFSIGQKNRRWLRVLASPLPGDPQPGVVVTVHDETRLKALEELRREFVANVSHELKTPLASIKGYAETLLLGAWEDPDACQRFIGTISQQADRLELLINDMLQLARAQGGPEAIKLTEVSVMDVLEESLASYCPVAERKPVTLVLEKTASDLIAIADHESLLTVVNNLVGNAVRYTPAGGNINVSATRADEWCQIVVRDDGPGIPPSDCQRIFERFYRVEKGRDSLVAGTGLGLAIAKNLVNSMKGTIEVDSVVGEGSTFTVLLPAAI